MTFRARTAIGLLLLVLAAPATSEAGLLSWLDALSGPGPFWGTDVEMEAYCHAFPKPKTKPGTSQTEGLAEIVGIRFPISDSCKHILLKQHRFTFLLTEGIALAANNPLDYGDDGHQTKSTSVWLFRSGGSVNYSFDMAVEIGAGAGVFYFAGPRFDNFVRPFVQPARLAVRPLLFVPHLRQEKNGWLIFEADWTRLLGTINGATFGAPGDPWKIDDRNRLELGVYLDLHRLLGMKPPCKPCSP
jgi:hypothetical protein